MMTSLYFVVFSLVVAGVSASICTDRRDRPVKRGEFKPVCDEDGSYAARQCQNARCFCVDKFGERISDLFSIGRAWETECKCAREKHELESNGLLGKRVKCDEIGNYEMRQCLGSVCFCVDPLSGHAFRKTVPINDQNAGLYC